MGIFDDLIPEGNEDEQDRKSGLFQDLIPSGVKSPEARETPAMETGGAMPEDMAAPAMPETGVTGPGDMRPPPTDYRDDEKAARSTGKSAWGSDGTEPPRYADVLRPDQVSPPRRGLSPDQPSKPFAADAAGSAVGRALQRGVLRLDASRDLFNATAAATAMTDAGRSEAELARDTFLEVSGMERLPEGVEVNSTEDAIRVLNDMGYPSERAVNLQEVYSIRSQNAQLARENPETFRERYLEGVLGASRAARRSGELKGSELSERMKERLQEDQTVGGTLANMLRHPLEAGAFLGEMGIESAPQIAASATVGLLTRSPTAGALTMGVGTTGQEYGTSAIEYMRRNDIRLESPEDAIRLLNDPQVLSDASKYGATRGLVIAAAETLGQGVAAKQILNSPLGNALIDITTQAATGAGGEAAAQVATGDELNGQEILLEGLGELVTAPLEVGAAGVASRRQRRENAQQGPAGGPPPGDRSRPESTRLTPEDRSSPIPNDVIDDGKAIIEEATNPRRGLAPYAPQAPQAGTQPITDQSPLVRPAGPEEQGSGAMPISPTSPNRPAQEDDFDLPEGAVPASVLYGDEESGDVGAPDAAGAVEGPAPAAPQDSPRPQARPEQGFYEGMSDEGLRSYIDGLKKNADTVKRMQVEGGQASTEEARQTRLEFQRSITEAEKELASRSSQGNETSKPLDRKMVGDITSALYDHPLYGRSGGEPIRLSLLPEEIAAIRASGLEVSDDGTMPDATQERLLEARDAMGKDRTLNEVRPEPEGQAAPSEPVEDPGRADPPVVAPDPSAGTEQRQRGVEVLGNDEVQSVETDAETFQYKGGADESGVTDRLRDVEKWDSNRTGIALVYEYEDGRRVVVDGHQRLGLAKRMIEKGQDVDLPVRVLRERDGVSESMARQIGAEKNIGEGTGTAMDAAKVFRESRQTAKDLNLPRSSQLVRAGEDLSKLSDDAFGMVVNEVASERDGAVVGRLVTDQNRQADVLGLLAKLKPANLTQAEAIARQAADAGTTETQDSLFGEEEVSANLYLERAKVLDRTMKDLGKDIQTFRTLTERGDTISGEGNVLQGEANEARLDADARARAVLMKQANTKGPISDALTEAAQSIKDGTKIAEAARNFAAAVRRGNGEGEGGGPQAGGARDGAGRAQEGGQGSDAAEAARPVEQTPEGEQYVVPGAEQVEAPVSENTGSPEPQMDLPEGGLFDDGARAQTDLADFLPGGGRDTERGSADTDADRAPIDDTTPAAMEWSMTSKRDRAEEMQALGWSEEQAEFLSGREWAALSPDARRTYTEKHEADAAAQAEADAATQAEFDAVDAAKAQAKADAPKIDMTPFRSNGMAVDGDAAVLRQSGEGGATRTYRVRQFFDEASGSWKVSVRRATNLNQGPNGATNPPDKELGTFATAEAALRALHDDGFKGAPPEAKGMVSDSRAEQKKRDARAAGRKAGASSEGREPPEWMGEELSSEWQSGYIEGLDDRPGKPWGEAGPGDMLRGSTPEDPKYKARGKLKKWEARGLAEKLGGRQVLDGGTYYGVLSPRPFSEEEVAARLKEVREERKAGASDATTETAAKPAPSKRPTGLTDEERARLDAINKQIADKLRNQTNVGLDPELVSLAVESASIYVRAGVRRFRDYVLNLSEATGLPISRIGRYARIAYNDVRDEMEASGEPVADMDDSRAVIAELARLNREEQEAGTAAEAETQPAPAEAPAPAEQGSGADSLSDAEYADQVATGFRADFAAGRTFSTITEARRRAAEITGERYTADRAKALEEAIEVATVLEAQQRVDAGATPRATYDNLVRLYDQQPILSERTSTSLERQAYSTPAPLAYLASQLGRIAEARSVYEPTAGNGMLLIEAEPTGILANELTESRVSGLRRTLGERATITTGDAMEADPGPYDALITNPPFGRVRDARGKIRSFDMAGMEGTTTEIDQAIALKGLANLGDEGRAVLIIGGQKGDTPEARKKQYQTAKNRKFFKKLYDSYNVTSHFTADGSLYRKQGAEWPVDVIVVEGRGASQKPYPMKEAPVLYDSWESLGDRINEQDRLDPREGGSGTRDRADSQAGETADAGPVPGRALDADRQDGAGAASGGGARSADRDGGRDRGPAGDARPDDGRGRDGLRVGDAARESGNERAGLAETASEGDARPAGDAGNARGDQPAGVPGAPVSRERVSRDNDEAETDYQRQYEPRSNAQFAVGTLVPNNMQQAVTRALTDLESRVGDIDDYVAAELGYTREELLGTSEAPGFFSAEQVDALALAIDNVSQGKGFIVGDQTGVGKGRFVAGMLRYAERKGHAPVFLTKDPGLYADMVRDMRDIGMSDAHEGVLMTNGNITGKNALPLSDTEGDVLKSRTPKKLKAAVETIRSTGRLPEGTRMLFTTYSQLQQVKGENTPRMAALQELAPNAMFVLDESHEAGGTAAAKVGDEDKVPRSVFVRQLLQEANGVVYSSATYAKNPEVMSLYFKTDISLTTDRPDDLGEVVSLGGVPLQQVMANMLVEAGQYARRERSFEGVELSLDQMATDVEMANRGAEVLRTLFRLDTTFMEETREAYIDAAAEEGMGRVADGAVGNAGMSSTNFASTMHNVASQFLLSIKVKGVVEKAVAKFKAGEKPIIALSNTNAAIIEEAARDEGLTTGDSLNVPFNRILERYLSRLRRITVKDENDNKSYIYLTDDDIRTHGGEAALDAFRAAEKTIRESDLGGLPGSPIDAILDGLEDAGINVGEITGRGVTLRRNLIEARDSSPAAKKRTMNAFNRGDVDALVINRSGSTGFSMHATDKPGNDGKKRHMIILQPEPNIDLFMQMLGRIHRTGQTELPGYTIAVSDLAVEKRPAAVLMRKMASLNANTTANKKSAVSLDNVVDFLNPYGDAVVAEFLREQPEMMDAMNLYVGDEKPKSGIAARFTGRLATLPPDEVMAIYDQIERNYLDYIEALDRMGMNTLEAKTLDLDARVIDETEIVEAKEASSPFGAAATLQNVDVRRLGKPYSPDELDAELVKVTGKEADASGDIGGGAFARQQMEDMAPRLSAALSDLDARITASEAAESEAKTDKARDKARDRTNRLRAQVEQTNATYAAVLDLIEKLQPGRVGSLTLTSNDQSVAAMSLGADLSRLREGSIAPSAITVRVAVADASREIRVPLSRFLGNSAEYRWQEFPSGQQKAVLRAFEEGQSESRESRQMVTGNIPAGFAQFGKGQIILYSQSDGSLQRGILLPKGMDAGKTLRDRPAKFADPAQVAEFLRQGNHGSRVVQSEDNVLRMSYNQGAFQVLVTTKGHKKYTLNKQVRELLGDWQQRRGAKVFRKTISSQPQLEQVLQIYADNLGTEYMTTIDRDAARKITGESVPDIPEPDKQPQLAARRDGDFTAAPSEDAGSMLDGLVRYEVTPEAREQAAALSAEIRAELAKAGLPNINVAAVENLLFRGADGGYQIAEGVYSNGLIMASMTSQRPMPDVVNHETIHALRDARLWGRKNGLFRDAEWKALQREARKRTDVSEQVARDYARQGLSEDLILEEAIADLYAEWRAGRSQPKGFLRTALQRIKAALDAIGAALRGQGFTTPESVFRRIESGAVGRRQQDLRRDPVGPAAPGEVSAQAALRPDREQQRTDDEVSKFVGTRVRHAVKHDTSVRRRKESLLRSVSSQPLDQAMRIPFQMIGGLDEAGRWKGGKWVYDRTAHLVKDQSFGFMNPLVERVRHGLIDRHGLPADYVERERKRGVDEAIIATEGQEHLEALSKANVGPEEAKVLQAMLTGETVSEGDLGKLAEPIRQAIDELGAEAVELGLISPESFERNRGTYLHRIYAKDETDAGSFTRKATNFFAGRRRKVIGDQFKGRGLFHEVAPEQIFRDNEEFLGARRGLPQKGDKVKILELRTTTGTDPLATMESPKGKVKRRVYWPADRKVPGKLDNYEDRGTYEVRGQKGGKIVLWRDFTKAERTKMGEILDARYTIGKTYALMAHDLATGRFFKDVAENEEWSRKDPPPGALVDEEPTEQSFLKRMWSDPEIEWVKVPDAKIPKSDAYRYGALAGRYVRSDIWRDLEEIRAMQSPNFYQRILTQWKLNKTARSPVVHMNNVMSNFILMDMADVRMPDLVAGIRSMASGDQDYQEAAFAGAFGADMVSQELRDTVLRPMLDELRREARGGKGGVEGEIGSLGKLLDGLYRRAKSIDRAMTSAYQMEDQIFRMATYIRRRNQGFTVEDAAVEARDQFLNYDIRAPWVNAARRSLLPFIAYTYRAVPKVAQTAAERPWKIGKYALLYQGLNMLSYSVAPSEWDEEDERNSMREAEQGKTWVGIERMVRMPYLDEENPVFLDVRRWIPAGDVFDLGGGDIPAWLHVGGPLVTGMELYLNKSAFTEEEIYNPYIDTYGERMQKRADFFYKSWMPSAPWVPGSWYWEKIKRAVFDNALEWGSNTPYSPTEAILSSAGIKLQPKDVEVGYLGWQIEFENIERELKGRQRSLARQRSRKLISEEEYQKSLMTIVEKRERLRQKQIDTFPK